MKKVIEILTTDIKLLNKYLLIASILVALIFAGSVSYALFSYEKQSNNTIKLTANNVPNLDTSGANEPDLVEGMIPVRYNGTNWVIADETNRDVNNQWYSYATSGETKGMWANAVLVKETGTVHNRDYYTNQANVGQTVSMDDILQMYVWIPRFVVDTGNYESTQAYMDSIKGTATDGNYMSPGAVNINFVDTNTTAHDAFTFGNKNLKGIWIGKFETTGAVQGIGTNANTEQACINETCNVSQVTIKPNFMPLLGQKISSLFYASRSLEQTNNPFGLISNEVDTHMMKNNEWGAVAYLSQSIYGRCTNSTTCPNIGTNTKNGYITGYGVPAGSHHDINNAAYVEPGTYETTLGQGASTTGNIYGIYDMSGGSVEYTMGVYWDNTNYWSGFDSTANSGFKGCLGTNCSSTYDGIEFFETATNSKYYNSYTTSNDYTNNSLQHAMTETARWYGNSAFFVNDYYPWCMRGGHYYYSDAGVFYSGGYNGGSGSNSIHLSLVK